ncbi:MAG: hypothetical protein FJX52_14355 [Alphaproteobacteria bacterium]|nr:hypothetical protein [Alphaproteobacteria bacterium]
MTQRAMLVAAAILAACCGLPAGMARADAIDGDWCFRDGRHMTIQGPQIVTPGGNKLAGNYSRHYFSYVVPAAEPEAGKTILMTLLNEETVHLRVGDAQAPVQVWRRCTPKVSALGAPVPGA